MFVVLKQGCRLSAVHAASTCSEQSTSRTNIAKCLAVLDSPSSHTSESQADCVLKSLQCDCRPCLCTGVFDALEPTDGHLLPTERASATHIWWGHVASRNHAAQAKLMAALSLGLYDALLLPARQADWAALLPILRFGSHKRGQACGALLERFLAHPCAR